LTNFNLSLREAEQGRTKEIEKYLRVVLKADPKMGQAAHNMGLLIFKAQPRETLKLCLKAYELQPKPRYGYTLAYRWGRRAMLRAQPCYSRLSRSHS